MATADEYAAWIVKNADKKGTPEFDTVSKAYQAARAVPVPAAPVSKDFAEGAAKAPWKQGLVAGTNGLLLGFGDELAGGVGAVIDKIKNPSSNLSDNYVANRDNVRGMEAAQRARAPIWTGIAQGLSAVPLTMVAPALAGGLRTTAAAPAVAGLGSRVAQAAAVGAGIGTVSGAGNSAASTAGKIAGDALEGGLISGALGGVGAPVAAGVGAVTRNVAQRMSDSAAAQFASQKLAEAFTRDPRGALAAGGMVSPLSQASARLGKLGDEAVLADAGGRNTFQLLDTLATLPGRTKDAAYNLLRQRTAGVGDRMRDAAERSLNTGGQRLGDTVESLITRRKMDSAPLYAQLRNVEITPSADLQAIVQSADKAGAVKLGRQIANGYQLPFSLDVHPPVTGGLMNQGAKWRMADLDHVKQGLDDLLKSSAYTKPDGTVTSLGRSITDLRSKLIAQLDGATTNPSTGASLYRDARAAFENPSKLIDAGKAGQQAISQNEAAIAATVKDMSTNELDAFRIGAFEGLRGKLGTQGGQTEVMNMWKNPGMQEKLRVIFGSERAYRTFAADVARESALKRLQGVGVGSQTAARQAGMGDLDASVLPEVGAAVGAAKTGNILSAIGTARNVWNRVATPQAVRDQMGAMLMSRGPEAQRTMNSLAPLLDRINQQNLRAANGVGVFDANLTNQLLVPAQPLPSQ